MKQPQNKYTAWQGSSWRLDVQEYQTTTGKKVEKGQIIHPGSVLLIPLRQGQSELELLLIRQYRPSLGQFILELPAGGKDHADEAWLTCAQRELQEETGFRAEHFFPLGEIWLAPGLTNERMQMFIATHLTPSPLPQDLDEQIELAPMPFSQALHWAETGQFTDAKTVVGIWRTAVYLRTQPLFRTSQYPHE